MAIAGGCLIAAAIYQTYAAVRGTFAQHNKLSEMSPGSVSCSFELGRPRSRALVLGLIGSFLIRTAIDCQAVNRHRVDGALSEVHRQPLGNWLLAVVAAGLLAFADCSCFEARYQRL